MSRGIPLAIALSLLFACGGGDGDSDEEENPIVDPCAGVTPVCDTADECGEGESCDACGRCVAEVGCSSAADCEDGEGCVEGFCVPSGCTGDEDCGEGQICHPEERRCIPAGTDCSVVGCDAGLHCREADGLCVGCIEDAHCEGEESFCREDGACVACRNNGDCDDGLICNQDSICTTCGSDDECGAGFCHEERCVECKSHGDCGLGFCSAQKSCVECLTSADCAEGIACLPDGSCDTPPVGGEPCREGGECAPGHLCQEEICRRECDAYSDPCDEGQRCAPLVSGGLIVIRDGRPAGLCMDSDPTLVGEGGACDAAAELICDVGLVCRAVGPDLNRCMRLCDPAEESPVCGDDLVCDTMPIGTGQAEVGTCGPDSTFLEACIVDADCGDGMVCLPRDLGNGPEGRCTFAAGEGEVLDSCNVDSDCKSNICHPINGVSGPGFCWGACDGDASCGEDGVCVGWTIGGMAADGCLPTCGNDARCEAYSADSACTVDRIGTEFMGVCDTAQGTGKGGDFCEIDADCASGICMDIGAGANLCLGFCETDLECNGNSVCDLAGFNFGSAAAPLWTSLQTCRGVPCTSSAVCGPSEVCMVVLDGEQPATHLETICAPKFPGTKTAGELCSSGAECRSGECLDIGGRGRTVCFEPCGDSTECAGDSTCAAINFGGGRQPTIRHCI